jgi:excisionase family DNA binding protein
MKQNEQDGSVYLTVSELATLTKLSESTIRRLISNGTVESRRIGGSIRIPKSYLAELVGA